MSKSSLQLDPTKFGNILEGQIKQSFSKAEQNPSASVVKPSATVPLTANTPKKTRFGKKIVVRINTEYVDLLDKKAYDDGISLNTAINQAIREYLNK
ncbi:MAG: hypothetical protein VZQ61_06775 [Christensenellaceae bacterium]